MCLHVVLCLCDTPHCCSTLLRRVAGVVAVIATVARARVLYVSQLYCYYACVKSCICMSVDMCTTIACNTLHCVGARRFMHTPGCKCVQATYMRELRVTCCMPYVMVYRSSPHTPAHDTNLGVGPWTAGDNIRAPTCARKGHTDFRSRILFCSA